MVSGQPRMALFAGDKPIMTGDELTYDYNFDPFSKKSIQQCLCGSDNCRGVLGPRKQEPKAPAKSNAKEAAKSPGKAGTKRKLSEMQGGEKASPRATKKARVVAAKAKGVAAKGVAAKGVAAKGVTAKTKGVAGKGVAAKSATVKSAMAKGVTAKGPTAKGATAKGATAKGATAKGKLIASKSKAGAYAATASKGKLGVRKSKPGASPAAKGKAKAVASAKKSTVTVKRITLKQSITVANRQGSAKKPSSQKADSARPVSVFSVRKKRVIIPSAKARAAAAEKSKSTANARAASGTVRTPKLKIVRKTKAAESSSEQDRAAPREDVDMEDAGPGEAEPSNVEIRVNVERGAEPEAVKGTEAPRNLSDSEDNGIAAKDVMDIALEKRLAEKENQEQPWYKSIGRFVPGRPARPLPSPSPSNSSGEAGNGLASKEKRQTKLRLVATGSEGRALGFGDNVNVDMDPYSDFDHTAGQSAAQATKMAAPVPG